MIATLRVRLVLFLLILVSSGIWLLMMKPSQPPRGVLGFTKRAALPACHEGFSTHLEKVWYDSLKHWYDPSYGTKHVKKLQYTSAPPVCVMDEHCGIFGSAIPGCDVNSNSYCGAAGFLQLDGTGLNGTVATGGMTELTKSCKLVAIWDAIEDVQPQVLDCMRQCSATLGDPPWLSRCVFMTQTHKICFKLWTSTWLDWWTLRGFVPLGLLISVAYLLICLAWYGLRRHTYAPLPTLAPEDMPGEEEVHMSTFWTFLGVSAAILDPVLDSASIFQFLEQGQPFYATVSFAAAAAGCVDVLQQSQLHHSAASLKRGFPTQEFLEHQVSEGSIEGFIGGNIALWSLLNVPANGFTLLSSIVWGLSACLTYARTFPGAIQASVLLQAHEEHGLNLDNYHEVKKFKQQTAYLLTSKMWTAGMLALCFQVPLLFCALFSTNAVETMRANAGGFCLAYTVLGAFVAVPANRALTSSWISQRGGDNEHGSGTSTWTKRARVAILAAIVIEGVVGFILLHTFWQHFMEQVRPPSGIMQLIAFVAVAALPLLMYGSVAGTWLQRGS